MTPPEFTTAPSKLTVAKEVLATETMYRTVSLDVTAPAGIVEENINRQRSNINCFDLLK
jgi:hypothetical protein